MAVANTPTTPATNAIPAPCGVGTLWLDRALTLATACRRKNGSKAGMATNEKTAAKTAANIAKLKPEPTFIARSNKPKTTMGIFAMVGSASSPVAVLPDQLSERMARETGLEPATFGVTGRRSNQLSYSPKTAYRSTANDEIRDPTEQVKPHEYAI